MKWTDIEIRKYRLHQMKSAEVSLEQAEDETKEAVPGFHDFSSSSEEEGSEDDYCTNLEELD